jgi:hypothetical protein
MSSGGSQPEVSVNKEENGASEGGLLNAILSLFFDGADPERRKRRALKQIAKNLNKQRYKFFKTRSEEALPGMARFFYDLYRVVGPAQRILQKAHSSKGLKSIVIESFLTEQQLALKARFDEQEIRKAADGKDTKEVVGDLKQAMVAFFGSFDSTRVKEINDVYNLLQVFLGFIQFDFYFVLKKFDASLPEQDFTYKPKFESISGEYIVDDLKDFLEVTLVLDRNANWGKVLDILQMYRNVDVVDRKDWNKILGGIEAVIGSEVLQMIVRYLEKDPDYVPVMQFPKDKIVEDYLTNLKTGTEGTIQKILLERRNLKIEKLCKQVFGTTTIVRTKNYTDQANLSFQKRLLAGYTHTTAINYLKAFLLDYFKKDIREVVRDVLLVRGRWGSNYMSQQLSEAFHQVMSISEQIVKFDDGLAEDGELGGKLRKAMGRIVEKDPATVKNARQLLSQINEQAAQMIRETGANLVVILKQVKSLMDDYEKHNPEIILNWKEIDGVLEQPLNEKLSDIYSKTYYFIQLMQAYTKK